MDGRRESPSKIVRLKFQKYASAKTPKLKDQTLHRAKPKTHFPRDVDIRKSENENRRAMQDN